MVGIVVVAHGRLAAEMVEVLANVLGKLDAIEAVTTSYEDTPAAMRSRIANAVARVDRGRGVLILTDMLGDTPTNQSLAVARDTGAEVVAGVSMPILVKGESARRDLDVQALAGFLQRYGQEHIVWPTESAAGARRAR